MLLNTRILISFVNSVATSGSRAMNKSLQFALIAGALLAGFGIFYHYVIFLPGVEARKEAAATAAQAEATANEQMRQVNYNLCLVSAERSYGSEWAAACADVSTIRTRQLNDCLKDKSITGNPYMGTQWCKSTYAVGDPSPDCSLPKSRADSINQALKDAKDRCATEARLGL